MVRRVPEARLLVGVLCGPTCLEHPDGRLAALGFRECGREDGNDHWILRELELRNRPSHQIGAV